MPRLCLLLIAVLVVACSPGEDPPQTRDAEPTQEQTQEQTQAPSDETAEAEPTPQIVFDAPMPTLLPHVAAKPTTSTACPPDHLYLPGGADLTFGETDAETATTCSCDPWILRARRFGTVPPFCAAKHPFPGEGEAWADDQQFEALNYAIAQDLRTLLPRWGRRLCTWSESLFLSAGATNRRFQWGDTWEDGRCEPDPNEPKKPIGTHPRCVTPEGLVDVAVRSNWTVLDDAGAPHLQELIDPRVTPGMLVVTTANAGVGGEGFARSNYGFHFHVYPWGSYDIGDPPGHRWIDDGLRVCADPGVVVPPAREAEYAQLRARVGALSDLVALWSAPVERGVSTEAGWTSVVAGRSASCGIRDRRVHCWGSDAFDQRSAPTGDYTSVDLGWQHGCALRVDGTIACWGDDAMGQASPPEGVFTSVGTGEFFSCGQRADGRAVCWGHTELDHWQDPPDESFETIAVGDRHACGVTNGAVTCWGDNRWPSGPPPAEYHFTTLALGYEEACGVQEDGVVGCWGNMDRVPRALEMVPGKTAVASGHRMRCTLDAEGRAECVDDLKRPEMVPPDVRFASISVGYAHACGVTKEGRIHCWGGDSLGQATPP